MMSQVLFGADPVLSYIANLNRTWPAPTDAPERVVELARSIWIEMRNSLPVIEEAHRFTHPPDTITSLLATYSEELFASW
jgi:hypothetical protein